LLVALIGGGLMAMVFGVVFGLPSLRIRGLYLAVATLAAQFFVDWLATRAAWVTNNSSSGSVSAKPGHPGLGHRHPMEKYLLCLAILCVLAWPPRIWCAAPSAANGWPCATWTWPPGDRHPPHLRQALGLCRQLHRRRGRRALGLCHLGAWEPAAFSLDRSLQLLFMIIIGGLGSVVGSIFGAAFFVLLPLLLNQVPHWLGLPLSTATATYLEHMIFGALIVFFLIVEPHGLAKLWATARQKLRVWPFPH
jgi:branched-chain amino acid transport system permease protein